MFLSRYFIPDTDVKVLRTTGQSFVATLAVGSGLFDLVWEQSLSIALATALATLVSCIRAEKPKDPGGALPFPEADEPPIDTENGWAVTMEHEPERPAEDGDGERAGA